MIHSSHADESQVWEVLPITWDSRLPLRRNDLKGFPDPVVFVRHAAVPENRIDVVVGSIDPSLDEVGFSQAKQLGKILTLVPISKIYSSGLKRALQTAAVLAKFTDAEIQVDERLNELDYGLTDGLPKSSAIYQKALVARQDNKYAFRYEGGESLSDVEARVRRFISGELVNSPNGTLIVAHLGVIRTFAHVLCNIPPSAAANLHADHLSISVVVPSAGLSFWGGVLD